MIKLGDEAKCKVTGFKGVVVARTQWLHGCDRVTLQPPIDKDGKMKGAETFDEMCVDITKVAKVQGDVRLRKTGGPQDDKAALRRN